MRFAFEFFLAHAAPMLKNSIKRSLANGFGVALMGLFAAIFCMREIDSDDLWLHMMAARHWMDGHGFPLREFYQYAGAGQSQHFPGVGFGGLYEWAVRTWGLGSATYVNSTVWGLAIALSCAAAVGRSGMGLAWRWAGWGLAFGVAALGFWDRANMRAESSAMLGWALCAWALSKSSERDDPKWILWTIPLASAMVGWMHTSVFLLALAWPAAMIHAWARPSWRAKPMLWRWALALACSLAFPMATPNGPKQALAQPIELMKVVGIISPSEGNKEVAAALAGAKKEVFEYLPLSDARVGRERLAAWAALLLAVIIGLGARASKLAACGKEERWMWLWDAVMAACLLGFAWTSMRGVGLAAFFLMGQMAKGLAVGLSRMDMKAGVAMGLCAAGLMMGADELSKDGRWGRQGPSTDYDAVAGFIAAAYPHGAKMFIDESGNPLPYLLGMNYTVGFTEHYMEPNPDADRHNRIMQLGSIEQVDEEARRLGVDVVCVGYAKLLPSGAQVAWLPLRLAGSAHWRLSLMGAPCAVFQRLGEPLDEKERLEQLTRYVNELGSIVEVSKKRTGSKKDADMLGSLGALAREQEEKLRRLKNR